MTEGKELIMFRLKIVDYFGDSKLAAENLDSNSTDDNTSKSKKIKAKKTGAKDLTPALY